MTETTPPADAPLDLTGKLLVAMPGMEDMRFSRSVVCICAHSEDGAMGLILNKPLPDLRLPALLEHLDLLAENGNQHAPDAPVHFGGPVEHGRGFVLHSPDYSCGGATLRVTPDIAMTGTVDILQDMLHGRGPAQAHMMLGYAGWAPGQLEAEMLANGWLSVDATAALVFDTPPPAQWEAALRALGVDPVMLSGAAGRA
ncbi:YqgE/AlgH family protein [Rhodobacteraceae bacterium 2376]|uniref:UPF0301 protein HUK65_03475 n=1 Tax=Rhabdonatronobacter sediminivivens TaxID=2743469 RepID=A0A7Z0HXM3_9RHOB|nr:YqgE/AlgH family protein [Rhabdonatronobacter sediminivivens]NYS24040.1 YqgE/AlgH family protein [Rhabdonatronobacter sediminivivens]